MRVISNQENISERKMRYPRRINLPQIALAISLLTTGCQSTPPDTKQSAATPMPSDRDVTLDDALSTDPCALRLGDITAALTMFYSLNKRLPSSLDELKPLAAPGSDLAFTCPVSSQPYVYSPEGLLSIGTNKKIIIWDATPAHNGSRWCILMPPAQATTAVSFELVALPERAFKTYIPAIQ